MDIPIITMRIYFIIQEESMRKGLIVIMGLLMLGCVQIFAQKMTNSQVVKSSPQNSSSAGNAFSTYFGVRDNGFSFTIQGTLNYNGKPLAEFNEYDINGIEYPVPMAEVKVLFPMDNCVQIATGFLLKTKLNWKNVKLVSSDGRFTINVDKLKRLSSVPSIKDYNSFNISFSNVITEKMEPIERKDDFTTYIYQFNGKDLVYVRTTKELDKIENGINTVTFYETLKDIRVKEIAVFFPNERVLYLTSGYKLYLPMDYIKNFKNRNNDQRIFIVTSPALKKKAEELYLSNIKVKYDNLVKAQKLYQTIEP
jgi:hypothetical protein